MTRLLNRDLIAPYLYPEAIDKWPSLIQIDNGPALMDRPEGWNFPFEGPVVRLQGVMKNGNHEWIHLPETALDSIIVHSIEHSIATLADLI